MHKYRAHTDIESYICMYIYMYTYILIAKIISHTHFPLGLLLQTWRARFQGRKTDILASADLHEAQIVQSQKARIPWIEASFLLTFHWSPSIERDRKMWSELGLDNFRKKITQHRPMIHTMPRSEGLTFVLFVLCVFSLWKEKPHLVFNTFLDVKVGHTPCVRASAAR